MATDGLVPADWSVDVLKEIDYIGHDHDGVNPSYAPVIDMHRWLQDLSDDISFVGDDVIDRTRPIATKRVSDFYIFVRNGYTFTDKAIEHLYDGSIVQGVEGVDRKIWEAVTISGNCPVINILQAGIQQPAFWNIDNNGAGFGLNSTTLTSHRFLIKVHDFVANGGDIDGRRLIGINRPWGYLWSEYVINGTERGKNIIALKQEDDFNNNRSVGAVSALTGISNTVEGFNSIDADASGVPENYYSAFNWGANSVGDLYEWAKLQAYDGSAATLYGLPASSFRGITHEVPYDALINGAFTEAQPITFGNDATAQILADNGTDTLWVQLLTGVAPIDNDTITQGGVTAVVNGVLLEKPIKAPFIGASTGTAIIGAFGVGITSTLTTNDKLTDLSGTPITPPNLVSVTIGNLYKGSCTVFDWDGTTFDVDGNPLYKADQMSINTALTGVAETQVVVNAIPDNTPDSGTIRIGLDSGGAARIPYSSRDTDTNTYTIASTDFSGDGAAISNNVWNAYIDETINSETATTLNFTYTFGSNTFAVLEVRDSPNLMQPYIQPLTLGSASQTVNAIRNSDA